MKAIVHVSLKEGVLDPQGKAIGNALIGLGFPEVENVRQGKYIELELADLVDRGEAEAQVKEMCEKLLANTVIEDYRIKIE
jgi:phosphoribosylformylglycinamidine synthase PurS subunit